MARAANPWNIQPEPGFAVDHSVSDGGNLELCSFCNTIDFEAIFHPNPKVFRTKGQKVCKFVGLKSSMLESLCPFCRALASLVFNTNEENSLKSKHSGKLLACHPSSIYDENV